MKFWLRRLRNRCGLFNGRELMMKRKKYFLIVTTAIAVTVALFLIFQKNSDEVQTTAKKSLEDIKTIQAPQNLPLEISAPSSDAATFVKEREESIKSEFRKCFKKETNAKNIEEMKSTLLQQKDYSAPSLIEESYELTSEDQKELVVQHIPMEENENKVRVFSINPNDGLPDRIKDFPHSSAEISLRLKGALSMGTLKSKSNSTTQNSYDGSLLSIDEKNGKAIRLHLITASFDFECKEQSCQCLKKE